MGKRLGSEQICGSFICNVAKTRSRSCHFTQLSLLLASHLLLWHSSGIHPWCRQAAWQLLYAGGSEQPPHLCVACWRALLHAKQMLLAFAFVLLYNLSLSCRFSLAFEDLLPPSVGPHAFLLLVCWISYNFALSSWSSLAVWRELLAELTVLRSASDSFPTKPTKTFMLFKLEWCRGQVSCTPF